MDPVAKAASEAKAREKIASLKLMVYTEGGALTPYEPSKTLVESVASRIRAYDAAKAKGKDVEEKKAALKAVYETLVAKIGEANLRSAKALLKKVHKLEVRNENAPNVKEFHEAMMASNAGRRNAVLTKLAGMQEMVKSARKTLKASKVGTELQALRNAGYAFNDKYKLTAEDHTMLKLLSSGKAAKVMAAQEHFAEALAARQKKLAEKVKKAEKANLELNSAALNAATTALKAVKSKVDPKNAERYARILALATGSGLDIKPEHYYGIFREAFKTRRAKKTNNGSKAGAGAGAGAGAAATMALLNVSNNSESM
jgi:hypothetical protein